MPMGFVIGVIVLIVVFLVLYFIYTMGGGGAETPESQKTSAPTVAEQPPKPSVPSSGGEVDPFKSAEPPKS